MIDGFDAIFDGVGGAADVGTLIVDVDATAVGGEGTGENLDEGRFTSAVIPQQADDFVAADG